MKFDCILGTPTLVRKGHDTYYIVVYNLETSRLDEYDNLTREEALKLPFMKPEYLDMLK